MSKWCACVHVYVCVCVNSKTELFWHLALDVTTTNIRIPNRNFHYSWHIREKQKSFREKFSELAMKTECKLCWSFCLPKKLHSNWCIHIFGENFQSAIKITEWMHLRAILFDCDNLNSSANLFSSFIYLTHKCNRTERKRKRRRRTKSKYNLHYIEV